VTKSANHANIIFHLLQLKVFVVYLEDFGAMCHDLYSSPATLTDPSCDVRHYGDPFHVTFSISQLPMKGHSQQKMSTPLEQV
jgi:hypothetical protein